jgi:hypothetical protein
MNRVLLISGIVGTLILIFIIFGISIMGDRHCEIEIQNGREGKLILKTFKYFHYEKTMTVDSVSLGRNEKIEIGHCINCTTPDTVDIDFDAIGIYDSKGNFKLMNKGELITYLETMDKDHCVTYIVQ